MDSVNVTREESDRMRDFRFDILNRTTKRVRIAGNKIKYVPRVVHSN